jgi:hypothetical protein
MSEEQNDIPISRPRPTTSLASPTTRQYTGSTTPSYNNILDEGAFARSLNPPPLQLHAAASAGHFDVAHDTLSASHYSHTFYQSEPSASYNTSYQPFISEPLTHNSQDANNDIHTICTYTYNNTSHTDVQHTITTRALTQQYAPPLWGSQHPPAWKDEGTGSMVVEAGDLDERKDDVGIGYSARVLKEIGTTDGPYLLEVSCMGAWANEA